MLGRVRSGREAVVAGVRGVDTRCMSRPSIGWRRRGSSVAGGFAVCLASLAIPTVTMTPAAHAQATGSAAALRSTYPSELGVDDLGGVTFDAAGQRLIVSSRRAEQIASIDAVGDSFAEVPLPGLPDPATLSVDPKEQRLTAVAGGNVVSTPLGGDATSKPLRNAVPLPGRVQSAEPPAADSTVSRCSHCERA